MPTNIYHRGESGLGDFAPSGEPKNLNEESTGKPEGLAEANKALAELGASITKAKKYSSLNVNAAKIDIPKEQEGKKGLYNQKI